MANENPDAITPAPPRPEKPPPADPSIRGVPSPDVIMPAPQTGGSDDTTPLPQTDGVEEDRNASRLTRLLRNLRRLLYPATDPGLDESDITRLGKAQQFRRQFNTWSTLAYTTVNTATWEFVLVNLVTGLALVGPAALLPVFIATVVCYSTIVFSLVEMASMAPTAGGQYHWVSEFAPKKCQKILSYVTGWLAILGWISAFSASVFVNTTVLQFMIVIWRTHDHSLSWFPNWQFTIIMLAVLFTTIPFNVGSTKFLSKINIGSFILHLLGFFVILGLLCKAGSGTHFSAPFTSFSILYSGFPTTGMSCLMVQLLAIYCLIGSDSAVHISEEVNRASIVVSQGMWRGYVLNSIMGIAILIPMLYAIEKAVPGADPATFSRPGQAIFSMLSTGERFLIMVILFLLIFAGNITTLATATRQVWAFARDKGLPFSSYIAHVSSGTGLPTRAVILSAICAACICAVNFASLNAFEFILSVNILALLSTYWLSIGCILLMRLRGTPLPPARWTLGRWGLPINMFAFSYCSFVMVCACLPYDTAETASARWAWSLWVGWVLLAMLTYWVFGKKRYMAPVHSVDRKEGVLVDLTPQGRTQEHALAQEQGEQV